MPTAASSSTRCRPRGGQGGDARRYGGSRRGHHGRRDDAREAGRAGSASSGACPIPVVCAHGTASPVISLGASRASVTGACARTGKGQKESVALEGAAPIGLAQPAPPRQTGPHQTWPRCSAARQAAALALRAAAAAWEWTRAEPAFVRCTDDPGRRWFRSAHSAHLMPRVGQAVGHRGQEFGQFGGSRLSTPRCSAVLS